MNIDVDIVLIDLLMAKIDGISVVKTLKDQNCEASFIMISQVKDKSMVENAYKAGVELFINKPINIIEVRSVLSQVIEKRKMEDAFKQIKECVRDISGNNEEK